MSGLTLDITMQRQPDDRSCGPTCLQAVYRYLGLGLDVQTLVDAIPQLDSGGTLAVQLGCDALRRGFKATIYTYNLQLFDPTWFLPSASDLAACLVSQSRAKAHDTRLCEATQRYLEFLELGGRVEYEMLTPQLVHRLLLAQTPILTGLSATYLYETMREIPERDEPNDIHGEPVGHFVVLCGYDPDGATMTLADPWPDPRTPEMLHVRPLFRVIASILLGVLTYDANLLVIEPS